MKITFNCTKCNRIFEKIYSIGIKSMSSTECPVCKTISSRVYKSVNVGDIVNDTIIEASNYMMYGEKLENPNFKKIL